MEKNKKKRVIKIEVSKNYVIEVYEKPPRVIKYVRKVIKDKKGFYNIVTIAIVKDTKGGTKAVLTSFWRPINKPSAQRILKRHLKLFPKKVIFKNEEVKKKYLKESVATSGIISFSFKINRSVSHLFEVLYG
jgi:hypothetical protein